MTKSDTADNQRLARKSTLVVSGVFVVLAIWNLYRGRELAGGTLATLGGCLAVIGLFVPPLARRFDIAWMRLAAALGYANSRILLSLMYYGVMTPIGLMTRVAGRNPLNRRGAASQSYWKERCVPRQTKEGFERAF